MRETCWERGMNCDNTKLGQRISRKKSLLTQGFDNSESEISNFTWRNSQTSLITRWKSIHYTFPLESTVLPRFRVNGFSLICENLLRYLHINEVVISDFNHHNCAPRSETQKRKVKTNMTTRGSKFEDWRKENFFCYFSWRHFFIRGRLTGWITKIFFYFIEKNQLIDTFLKNLRYEWTPRGAFSYWIV